MTQPNVSVVIPALNAADRLPRLLELLQGQSLRPAQILVVDSSSTDGTAQVASSFDGVQVNVIDRATFNHGTTRHEALLATTGEYVCFLTDDAVPANADLLKNLLRPFCDPQVAMASGRQLPKPQARRFEQLVRGFNYPDVSHVRSRQDLPTHGIKTFYLSDVCALYRRSAYLAVGGFRHVNTNEDMLIAAAFVHAGYKVAYAADAQVLHSHDLSPREQYVRNKAVGEFLETHSDELRCPDATGEGVRLVKAVSAQLLREGRFGELAAFGLDCAARLLGNRAGRRLARTARREG